MPRSFHASKMSRNFASLVVSQCMTQFAMVVTNHSAHLRRNEVS